MAFTTRRGSVVAVWGRISVVGMQTQNSWPLETGLTKLLDEISTYLSPLYRFLFLVHEDFNGKSKTFLQEKDSLDVSIDIINDSRRKIALALAKHSISLYSRDVTKGFLSENSITNNSITNIEDGTRFVRKNVSHTAPFWSQ